MPGVDYGSVRAWRISNFTGIDQLKLSTSAIQPPQRGQVAVRIHACSLNYRDLIIAQGKYVTSTPTLPPYHPSTLTHNPSPFSPPSPRPPPLPPPQIPGS